MLRELRAHVAAAHDADLCRRVVVDALLPVSNDLWQQLPVGDQDRFLRHLRTFWETHRHRMAPQIRARLDECRAHGLTEIIAGRFTEAACGANGMHAVIQLRQGGERVLDADRVISCTGIQEDYRKSARPLVRSLIETGVAQANALGIGLRTGPHGALLQSDLRPSPVFFTLGPPRRGELFETTAVPEIRVQAEALARHLTRPPVPD